jgi:stage V sporulation protein AC
VWFHLDDKDVAAFTAMVMVFLGATLTGLGIYDKIGGFAGAGSVVPITGFANSIVAPAMEFRTEGYVMGVGAKLFSLAGPVLVYGISSSVVVGLLSLLFGNG